MPEFLKKKDVEKVGESDGKVWRDIANIPGTKSFGLEKGVDADLEVGQIGLEKTKDADSIQKLRKELGI